MRFGCYCSSNCGYYYHRVRDHWFVHRYWSTWICPLHLDCRPSTRSWRFHFDEASDHAVLTHWCRRWRTMLEPTRWAVRRYCWSIRSRHYEWDWRSSESYSPRSTDCQDDRLTQVDSVVWWECVTLREDRDWAMVTYYSFEIPSMASSRLFSIHRRIYSVGRREDHENRNRRRLDRENSVNDVHLVFHLRKTDVDFSKDLDICLLVKTREREKRREEIHMCARVGGCVKVKNKIVNETMMKRVREGEERVRWWSDALKWFDCYQRHVWGRDSIDSCVRGLSPALRVDRVHHSKPRRQQPWQTRSLNRRRQISITKCSSASICAMRKVDLCVILSMSSKGSLLWLFFLPTRASIDADGSSSSSICMDVTTLPSFNRFTINGLRTGFDHCCCCSWSCTASKRLLCVGVDGWLELFVDDVMALERWFNGEWWPLLVTFACSIRKREYQDSRRSMNVNLTWRVNCCCDAPNGL